MTYYTALAINLSCAMLPVIGGWIRIKSLDKASRIIFLAVAFSFVTECFAFFAAKAYHNNAPVYNIGNIIQLFIIALYFNGCVKLFQKSNIGLYIGLFSVALGILNLCFLESFDRYNSNFFLYQAVLIFIMGTFYFRQVILPSYVKKYLTPHLWFTIILVAFYTLDLFALSLYSYFLDQSRNHTELVDNFILAFSAISNVGFACVFFFYPKMTLSDVG
jgi:hypothetical protein